MYNMTFSLGRKICHKIYELGHLIYRRYEIMNADMKFV